VLSSSPSCLPCSGERRVCVLHNSLSFPLCRTQKGYSSAVFLKSFSSTTLCPESVLPLFVTTIALSRLSCQATVTNCVPLRSFMCMWTGVPPRIIIYFTEHATRVLLHTILLYRSRNSQSNGCACVRFCKASGQSQQRGRKLLR